MAITITSSMSSDTCRRLKKQQAHPITITHSMSGDTRPPYLETALEALVDLEPLANPMGIEYGSLTRISRCGSETSAFSFGISADEGGGPL